MACRSARSARCTRWALSGAIKTKHRNKEQEGGGESMAGKGKRKIGLFVRFCVFLLLHISALIHSRESLTNEALTTYRNRHQPRAHLALGILDVAVGGLAGGEQSPVEQQEHGEGEPDA